MQNRHAVANELFPRLNDYWGGRIKAQLKYLEELNNAQNAGLDALLDSAVELSARLFEADGSLTKHSATEIEAAMKPASSLAKSITVSCIGHAHIDMNWMWGYDETVQLTVDTMRTMLAFMREYPDFTFGQSQASVYQIIENYAPEMLPEIRERIREGRWEVVASTWVEADKNMPNGESMARQLLYTRKYLKELLGLADDQFQIDYEPDTFGHGANVPEILRSGGVKYYYHCRGYDGHHLYRWRAPSGADIIVFREPTWYIDNITTDSFMHAPRFCAEYKTDRMLRVYGVGDHGGGATRRDIERIIDYSSWPCMPTIVFGRYIDFFKYVENLNLPVVDRELNFVFDGCYTSQSRIKKANRVSEAKLFEAEALNSISHFTGAYPCDAKAFGKLWRNTLFNHFHDILPGSGTIECREYAMGAFQQTMSGVGTRLAASARGISSMLNTAALLPCSNPPTDSIAEGAGTGFDIGYLAGTGGYNYTAFSSEGGKQRLFVLFNPSQAAIETASLLTVWDWEGDMGKIKVVDDARGALEHELIDAEPQDFGFHKYFRVSVACEIPPFGYRTVLLDEGAVLNALSLNKDPRVIGPEEYILENDYVRAVFDSTSAALVSFSDKETGIEYVDGEPGGLFRYIEEDPSRGMTSWIVGRHASDAAVAEGLKITKVTGSLVRKFTFEAPVKNSLLKATVSLDKNARHLRYAVLCDWREFGDVPLCGTRVFGATGRHIPQLAFRVPLAYECSGYEYDNALGIVNRPGLEQDVPAQSFAFAPRVDGMGGLMLSSDSKYGFRGWDNAVAISLIRSSYTPDPAPEICTHAFCMNIGIVKNAAPPDLIDAALRQTRSAIAVTCPSHDGALPLRSSFIRILDGHAVISSVKTSEDSEALIIRCYDVTGKRGSVTLELFREVRSALYVDSHENEIQGCEPSVGDKTVTLNLRAFGLTAVKIMFH